MKKLAGISLIALLALTGCSSSSPAESKYSSPNEAESKSYDPSDITPVLHQNLTAEEHAALDAKGVPVAAGDDIITILPTAVTDSDGTKKNGEFVQGKHIRMVIDTSAVNYDCIDDKYSLWEAVGVSGTRLSEGYEDGDCSPKLVVSVAPEKGAEWNQGREGRGVNDPLPKGRNVVEFDAIHGDFTSAMIMTQNTWLGYNASTGEVISDKPVNESMLHPYVLPGTVPTEQDIASMKPQRSSGEDALEIGKVTVTKGDYDRSVIHIPVISNATTPYCTKSKPIDCLDFSIITKKTGSDLVSQSYSSIPEKYKGEITVSTPEFDEAHVELTDGHGTITRINLLTGASEVIEYSAQ